MCLVRPILSPLRIILCFLFRSVYFGQSSTEYLICLNLFSVVMCDFVFYKSIQYLFIFIFMSLNEKKENISLLSGLLIVFLVALSAFSFSVTMSWHTSLVSCRWFFLITYSYFKVRYSVGLKLLWFFLERGWWLHFFNWLGLCPFSKFGWRDKVISTCR